MIAFYILIVTTLLAWHTRLQKVGFLSFGLLLGIGWFRDNLDVLAVFSALVLGLLVYFCSHKNKFVKYLSSIGMVVLTLALFSHQTPGFHNIKVWDGIHLSPNSAPATLYLNFDKPLFGILFLLFFSNKLTFKSNRIDFLKTVAKSLTILLVIIISVGIATKFIVFEPKLTTYYFIWALNNLLLVCVGEEVLFRGYIQRGLCSIFQNWKYGQWLGLVAASVLFGIAHFAGGITYVGLSTIAGFFYGWAYKQTETIESAILVHFLLNSIHFVLFTYPFYMPSL